MHRMTRDEQVVIDVLQHHAQTWDATDPQQAETFRDAARVLTAFCEGQIAAGPPDSLPTTPSAQDVTDPDETPAAASLTPETVSDASVHTPTDPDAEIPVP